MIEAWLEAIAVHLRASYDWKEGQCGVQPEGHPPASMGEFYVAIDEAGVQSGEKSSLTEIYTVNVFLTRRVNVLPSDRGSTAYRRLTASLSLLERRVIVAVHGQQAVRIEANRQLGILLAALEGDENAPGGDGEFGDAFQQPLWYTGRSKAQMHGKEWTGSVSKNEEVFLVRTLPFVGGVRPQSLAIMK